MQFTAIILMAILTFKLLMLPNKVAINPMVNKARWLMAASMFLLAVQFLIQYALHLRQMGVTQAVMVNLIFFIPCSWMISVAVLNLQGKERVTHVDRWLGGFTWLLGMALIGYAAAIDGQPLFSDTPELQYAEIACSVLYAAMQGHYAWRHGANLRKMRHVLRNYYDRDMDYMLRWMQLSVIILVVLTIMVPILIFGNGPWLATYSIVFFASIFYMVDNFCSYVVSSAPSRFQEAEESDEEDKREENKREKQGDSLTAGTDTASDDTMEMMQNVEHAVNKWLKAGGYLKSGMKLPIAAAEIGVPQYQLTAWLRQQNLKYSDWITGLRIEDAKRMLLEHPEWTSEAIAENCGFTTREYFHRIFRSTIGMTPAQYQQRNT